MGKKFIQRTRIPEVRVDFGGDASLSGMHVANDGTLTFFGEHGEALNPKTVEVGSVYARQSKGAKTIARLSVNPGSIQLDQNRALTRYEYVVAVDTNTRLIGSVAISITSSALVRDIIIGDPKWEAKLVRQDAFEFHNATASPERVGWSEVIQLIRNSGVVGSIGIIVDAHLGELPALNARTEAICRGYSLPEDFELLFGTTDAGTVENIANAAIADCDRISKMLLEQVESGRFPNEHYRLAPRGSPYSQFRTWRAPSKPTDAWSLAA